MGRPRAQPVSVTPVAEAPAPTRFVATSARALAAHFNVSRATAYRMIERLKGAQHNNDNLRLTTVAVKLGKGATRTCVAVALPEWDESPSSAPEEDP